MADEPLKDSQEAVPFISRNHDRFEENAEVGVPPKNNWHFA
jgi:hypothetical protein